MAKRVFKWKLAIVILIGVIVFGVTIYSVRNFQRARSIQYSLTTGLQAYEEGNWQEAARYLGRYIAVHQEDDDIIMKYARAQMERRPMQSGHFQQAIAAYRSVLRADPANSEAARNVTGLYIAMDAHAEAELVASRFLEREEDRQIRRMLAMALFAQREFADAADQIKQVIEQNPDFVGAYETISGFARQRPQDFDRPAIFWLDQAIEQNPDSALAYLIRANFHLRQGDRQAALDDLEVAEQKHGDDPDIILHLADAFLSARQPEKTDHYLEKVKQIKPDSHSLWRLWAQRALTAGQSETMIQVADEALEHLPAEELEFTAMAAELYIRGQSYEKAQQCLEIMRSHDANPGQVAFLEGLLAENTGNIHQAVAAYRNALELGNTSPQVRLALAEALGETGDPVSAKSHLESVIASQPQNAGAHLQLADIFLQQGQYQDAVDAAQRAIELQPENPRHLYTYVRSQIAVLDQIPPEQYDTIRENIHRQLDALKEIATEPFRIDLLRFRVAMHEADFSRAENILTELADTQISEVDLEMSRVQLLLAQNQPERAEEKLQELTESHPAASRPAQMLAMLHLRDGRPEQGVSVLENAVEHIEQGREKRDLSVMLADLYRQQGRPDDEYEILSPLAQENADDIELQRRLLQCRQVHQDLERAQQIVERIESLEGSRGWRWRYEQALLYFRQDDFDRYFTDIESLLQENLRSHPDHLRIGAL